MSFQPSHSLWQRRLFLLKLVCECQALAADLTLGIIGIAPWEPRRPDSRTFFTVSLYHTLYFLSLIICGFVIAVVIVVRDVLLLLLRLV